ncbi:hypothetical protein [Sphingomonas baiyangensis]|uniref:Uncharacterized protein n=1 Tax=Sphingomonas baiyangensis TaxID=2572576 RepID=A0A4U1L1Y8_9SPHN|nr:hypothetical protein [Sphingomonas baiyangensis]TKD50183.1 hypothetical protein FBR43_05010 [Sphingomonas baiyangensis]
MQDEKPWARLREILDALAKDADAVRAAEHAVPQVAQAVANMEVIYKDSYNRRSVDAVASTAIREVMAEATERATTKAREAHNLKKMVAAENAEQLRTILCNEAAKLSVALGVYARQLKSEVHHAG